jgi:hypothetical protein
MRMLVTAAASPALLAQAPPPPAQPADSPELQSARTDLQDSVRRIARVKLPRSTEPAFRFRA